jgi:hypothetical protein
MTSTELIAADETLYERRIRSLTLRNAGATYNQIAEKTGVSLPTARKDVAAALREIVAETAEDMIARQRAVLFDIQRANYAAAASGDIDAARIILATLEREARLFGLDAPTRVNVGVSDVEFAEKTALLITSLGLTPPKAILAALGEREVVDAELLDDDYSKQPDSSGEQDFPPPQQTSGADSEALESDDSPSHDSWSNI